MREEHGMGVKTSDFIPLLYMPGNDMQTYHKIVRIKQRANERGINFWEAYQEIEWDEEGDEEESIE